MDITSASIFTSVLSATNAFISPRYHTFSPPGIYLNYLKYTSHSPSLSSSNPQLKGYAFQEIVPDFSARNILGIHNQVYFLVPM